MRTNKTRFLVLGLLSLGPSSGYDVRRSVAQIASFFWHESYGQIYPVLGRLASERLIRRKTERTGKRPRHVYSITAEGRRALVRWLHAPVEPEVVRRELLLKLFFGRNVPATVLARHVSEFRDRVLGLGERVAAIERQLRVEPGIDRDVPYWSLTTQFGKEVSGAFVRWSDAALAELAKRGPAARAARRPRRKPEGR